MENVTEFLEMAAAALAFCLAIGLFSMVGTPIREQLSSMEQQTRIEQSMGLEEINGCTW